MIDIICSKKSSTIDQIYNGELLKLRGIQHYAILLANCSVFLSFFITDVSATVLSKLFQLLSNTLIRKLYI